MKIYAWIDGVDRENVDDISNSLLSSRLKSISVPTIDVPRYDQDRYLPLGDQDDIPEKYDIVVKRDEGSKAMIELQWGRERGMGMVEIRVWELALRDMMKIVGSMVGGRRWAVLID